MQRWVAGRRRVVNTGDATVGQRLLPVAACLSWQTVQGTLSVAAFIDVLPFDRPPLRIRLLRKTVRESLNGSIRFVIKNTVN